MSVRVFQYIEKEGTGKHVDFPSAGLRLGKMIRTNIENWYEFTFLDDKCKQKRNRQS